MHPVFSRYLTLSHQLTTRGIPSNSNLSSPPDLWRKYVKSNMQLTDSWNHFNSTGTPLRLNVLSNLERLRPKRLFVILSMMKVSASGWEIAELNDVYEHLSFALSMNLNIVLYYMSECKFWSGDRHCLQLNYYLARFTFNQCVVRLPLKMSRSRKLLASIFQLSSSSFKLLGFCRDQRHPGSQFAALRAIRESRTK